MNCPCHSAEFRHSDASNRRASLNLKRFASFPRKRESYRRNIIARSRDAGPPLARE